MVFATLEALLGLAPHNLLGIEIVMYALFTIPAILGAFIGGAVRWSIWRVVTGRRSSHVGE